MNREKLPSSHQVNKLKQRSWILPLSDSKLAKFDDLGCKMLGGGFKVKERDGEDEEKKEGSLLEGNRKFAWARKENNM